MNKYKIRYHFISFKWSYIFYVFSWSVWIRVCIIQIVFKCNDIKSEVKKTHKNFKGCSVTEIIANVANLQAWVTVHILRDEYGHKTCSVDI
jgi:hypothetical protein